MFSPTLQLRAPLQVAGAADAVDEARPAERVVREEVPAGHGARVAARRRESLRFRRSGRRPLRARCAFSRHSVARTRARLLAFAGLALAALQAPAADADGAATQHAARGRLQARQAAWRKACTVRVGTSRRVPLAAAPRAWTHVRPRFGDGRARVGMRGCHRQRSSTWTAPSSTRTTTTRSPGSAPSASTTIVLPIWRIHRHIGMGGDQLVASLARRASRRRRRATTSAPRRRSSTRS